MVQKARAALLVLAAGLVGTLRCGARPPAGAGAPPGAPGVTVRVAPLARRTVGGVGTLDRTRWFGGHWTPRAQGVNWRPQDVDLFERFYRAHPGRSFYVSGRMAAVREDPDRPGFVDVEALRASCAQNPPVPASGGAWSVSDIDMIVSSKTEQLYPNSCDGKGGPRPKGFMPGSHAAAAEFFALFYRFCMPPTAQSRAFIEVANECDVKTGTQACNSTWEEMIALHVAVSNAVRKEYGSLGTSRGEDRVRPLVCGPAAAFPEYQANDFLAWREGGQFKEFVGGTNGSIDCLSVHLYSFYGGNSGYSDEGPFSTNFSTREGGNLLATLDLQEAATAGTTLSAPLLVSEYGAGFRATPTLYTPAHDFWIMRAVNSMLMTFMDRPDRIAKALPFIVDKATWDARGLLDNATESYPFVLWRNVTLPNGTTAWLPTHIHKLYATWRDFDGDRFFAASDDANVQTQAFGAAAAVGDAGTSQWRLALNNLNVTASVRVALSWASLPPQVRITSAYVRRLSWDAGKGEPVVVDTNISSSAGALPAAIVLGPAELAIVTVRAKTESGAAAVLAPRGPTVDLRTLHSTRMLVPLASSEADAKVAPHIFEAGAGAPLRVRVSLGGDAAKRAAVLATLEVRVNGLPCGMDPRRQIAGRPHINHNDGSFFTAIETEVPTAVRSATRSNGAVEVLVWAEAAAGSITVSTVSLVTGTEVA